MFISQEIRSGLVSFEMIFKLYNLSYSDSYFIPWDRKSKKSLNLRVVQTQITLFLKSMSEKVGSDIH